jgi:uncharacterized protein YbaP (TraB family)
MPLFMFWKAALLAFALATPGCSPSPEGPQASVATTAGPAKPGLWKVTDADTTIYFFGTVHVLPPDLAWHSEAVDKAFDQATTVYFETDLDPDIADFNAIIERLGTYEPSDRLQDHLGPANFQKVVDAAKKLDVSITYLNTLRPWYAAVILSDAVIRHAGYDSSSGVERTLGPVARRGGKEIRKFETIEQQMLSFSTLPEADQFSFLIDGLNDIDSAGPTLSNMVNTWKVGETNKLQHILIDEDLGRTPAIYDALLARRNGNWAPIIDHILTSEQGTFFIAVGAAHLIGKDSVFEKLKPFGYTAERIQ